MPKDFKNNPAPRAEGRTAHPMLLGMIIGMLIGIVIALSVALWLNRLSNPFVEKGKPLEPLAKIPGPESTKPDGEKPAEKTPGKPAKSERPRFEFYSILPGEREVSDKDVKAAAARPRAKEGREPTAKSGPGSSPSQPKPHSGETYWLQAGAFAEEKDADNLKAKIALTGLEASVRPVNIPDKGTLYRVRLGPYQSLEDANRIKAALSQDGVGAAIIRTDEAKNP
jgi:cell division protein FtsN